jgi:hypothetical protein
MIDHETAWLAHHRLRWTRSNARPFIRPDAHLWIRPDFARFFRPGTSLAEVFPEVDRKYSPNQPRIPAGHPGGGRWTDGSDVSNGLGIAAPGGTDPAAVASDTAVGAPLAFQDENSGSLDSWKELLDQLAWKDPQPIPSADAADVEANQEPVGGGRRPSLSTWFPSASTEQLVRLDLANARTEGALAGIRRYEEDWQPREQSFEARPGGVDGAIARAEARAAEAESYLDRLRFGVGGNFSPPLDPPRNQAPDPPVFDGSAWIRTYRTINNSPDLFERADWPDDRGTVAAARIDGTVYFGVNSDAPGYSRADRNLALTLRDRMIEEYPDLAAMDNAGQMPNDAFFHAEANLLIRAERYLGGLADRSIEVQVDRPVCRSCKDVLPLLGMELGNPYVVYSEILTGRRSVMWNGEWLTWRRR